jgi:hypothetical protein
MTKTAFLFLSLLLFPVLSYAQISLTEGGPYKTYTGNHLQYFQSGNEMLSFKRDGDLFIIQKYNLNTLSQSGVMTYKDMPADHKLIEVKEFNKRIYFLYSLSDFGAKKAVLYAREIDFKTGTFVSQGIPLVTINGEIKGDFTISRALRDEKMMVNYLLLKTHMNDDVNHQTMGVHVFDKNLQPLWHTETEMPYAEKYIQYLTQAVDSEGNMHAVIRVYDKKTTDEYGIASEKTLHHLESLQLQKSSKELETIAFSLSSDDLRDINIAEPTPNEMMYVGFYVLENSPISSLFTCKINSDGTTARDKSYDIPEEIVNVYEDKENKTIKKDEKIPALYELNTFMCNTIQTDEYGDLLIIAEGNYGYYYDLLIARIDAQNNMEWMKRLPKRQYMGGPGDGKSYKLFSRATVDYIVFLDHEENKNLSIDQITAKPYTSSGTVLTAYKVNKSDGETDKLILLDTKEANGKAVYRLAPERILSFNDTEIVFEAYKKKNEDILIKIKGVE